jgi:protein-S-isoprenylcysteine O-methyltransferase Ste14
MFVLARALTYATLFVALLLVFVPARILDAAGITRPVQLGAAGVAGIAVTAAGAALVLWCVLSFSRFGHGTPAPFDPPRRLVRRGPYRHVRNPMYLGAAIVLCGAALFYRAIALLGYAAAFLLAAHLFVRGYEEPTLTRLFDAEYLAYRAQVGRWWPRRGRGQTREANRTQ